MGYPPPADFLLLMRPVALPFGLGPGLIEVVEAMLFAVMMEGMLVKVWPCFDLA